MTQNSHSFNNNSLQQPNIEIHNVLVTTTVTLTKFQQLFYTNLQTNITLMKNKKKILSQLKF